MKIVAIVIGLLILLGIIGAGVYFWGQTFLYTEGIGETQVSSYTETVDKAYDIQEKVNSSNKRSLDQLDQIQNSTPKSY